MEKFDKDNMYGSIWDFPENIKDALEIGDRVELKNKYDNIENIVIAGMGGSAISGDLVKLFLKNDIDVPITVLRDYSIPNWTNENTLFIHRGHGLHTVNSKRVD